MKRPTLNEVPLSEAMKHPTVIITMSEGQWDGFLEAAYERGFNLLELDEHEQPVRAYRNEPSAA